MKKADLKTGMIVTCRNGLNYLFTSDLDKSCLVGLTDCAGWLDLKNFSDDLRNRNLSEFDIVRVDELHHFRHIRALFLKGITDVSTINRWTRPVEKKKYTYSQLKEILGEEFEIVKD